MDPEGQEGAEGTAGRALQYEEAREEMALTALEASLALMANLE